MRFYYWLVLLFINLGVVILNIYSGNIFFIVWGMVLGFICALMVGYYAPPVGDES